MAVKTNKPKETGPALIALRELCVNFGRQPVLRDITLSVPRGQTLAVIGESGCGKTVLLKSIVGLVTPTRGVGWFDGNNLAKLNAMKLTQLPPRFGFVFQGAALFESLPVGQNTAFPLR